MPKKNDEKAVIAKLKKENAELKKQLADSKSKHRTSVSRKKIFRTTGFVVMLGLSAAIFVVAQLSIWAGRTLISTDKYVETVAPLIEQESIQTAVATKATEEIFSNVDITTIATDALPERAQFLAPAIATQVESFTFSSVKNIIASDKFASVWVDSQTKAHSTLLGVIRSNASQDGVIDLSEVYSGINDSLRDSNLSFLADRKIPDRVGSITLFESDQLRIANKIVVNAKNIRLISIVAFIGFFIGAVYLASNRRKAVIIGLSTYVALTVILGIAIRIAKVLLIDLPNPVYQAAASDAWRVIATPLYEQLILSGILGIVLLVIAYAGGQANGAVALRGRISYLLEGNIQKSLFKGSAPAWSLWIGAHRKGLLVSLSVVSLFTLALSPLTLWRLIAVAIVTALVAATIVVLGGKPSTKKKA